MVLRSLGGPPLRPSRIPVRRKGATTGQSLLGLHADSTAARQAGKHSHGGPWASQPPPGRAQHSPGARAAAYPRRQGLAQGWGAAAPVLHLALHTLAQEGTGTPWEPPTCCKRQRGCGGLGPQHPP